MLFFEPLDQFELVFLGYFKSIPINNSILYMMVFYQTPVNIGLVFSPIISQDSVSAGAAHVNT